MDRYNTLDGPNLPPTLLMVKRCLKNSQKMLKIIIWIMRGRYTLTPTKVAECLRGQPENCVSV